MAFCGTLYFFLMHNATKIRLSIPFLGIARPQSQFPHSCVCERFIYSQDWYTYLAAAKYCRQNDPGNF
jgi:hypothetical protein